MFWAVTLTMAAILVAYYPFLRAKLVRRKMLYQRGPATAQWERDRSLIGMIAKTVGVEQLDRLCQYAGRPYGLTGIMLLQYQFLFALFVTVVLGIASIALGVVAGLFCWFAPTLLLYSMAQQRRTQIALELPSFLDLWGLLVASGEGVETALVEICRRHPDWMLSSEVKRALERIAASGLFGESLVQEAKVTGSLDFVGVAEQISHMADGGGVPSKELARMAEQMREQRMADMTQSAGAMAVVGIFPKLGAVFLSLIPVMATIILTVVRSTK